MNPTDKPQFVTAVTALFETFGREVSDAQLLGYWRGLSDLSLDSVQHAVDQAFRNHERFVPTPAELRKLAGERSPDDAAVDAWSDLMNNVHIGPYNSIDFADPVINATVRAMGGWVCVCDKFAEGQSHEKWIRQEFLRAYVAIAKRPVGADETRALGGLSTGQYCSLTNSIVKPRPIAVGRERTLPTMIESANPSRPKLTHDAAGDRLRAPREEEEPGG